MHSYTEEEKARIRDMIGAFKGCQAHLPGAVANNGGICLALVRWRRSVPPSAKEWATGRRAVADACDLLTRALGVRWAYLEDWQYRDCSPRDPRRCRRQLAPRRRWLDQLIADCEAAL